LYCSRISRPFLVKRAESKEAPVIDSVEFLLLICEVVACENLSKSLQTEFREVFGEESGIGGGERVDVLSCSRLDGRQVRLERFEIE
jgi:hypothetical protein